MDENPYQAPAAAAPVGKQWVLVRLIVAALFAGLGIATGALAVHQAGLLLGRPGPQREVAMYGFPAFTIASVGCFLLAIGIASRKRRVSWIGAILFVAGIGGWFLFLYALSAGWFQ